MVSELPPAKRLFRQPIKTLLEGGEYNEKKIYLAIYVFNGLHVSL